MTCGGRCFRSRRGPSPHDDDVLVREFPSVGHVLGRGSHLVFSRCRDTHDMIPTRSHMSTYAYLVHATLSVPAAADLKEALHTEEEAHAEPHPRVDTRYDHA